MKAVAKLFSFSVFLCAVFLICSCSREKDIKLSKEFSRTWVGTYSGATDKGILNVTVNA